jgi:hypothetical protein
VWERRQKPVQRDQELIGRHAGQSFDVVASDHGIRGDAKHPVQEKGIAQQFHQMAQSSGQWQGVGNQPGIIEFHDDLAVDPTKIGHRLCEAETVPIIEKSPASADYGPVVRAPAHSESRRNISVVELGIVVIAHAEIHRHPGQNAPVVLREEADTVVPQPRALVAGLEERDTLRNLKGLATVPREVRARGDEHVL